MGRLVDEDGIPLQAQPSAEKRIVRIGVGDDEQVGMGNHHFRPSPVGNKGSFNMAVTAEERQFLERLAKAIKANCNRTSVLVVQDLEEG